MPARERRPVLVLRDPSHAASLLDGTRCELLALLQQPDSAAGLARTLDLPRQRVNYHVRELERAGLVEEVGTRARRGLRERVMRAAARHFIISPDALGSLGVPPAAVRGRAQSRFSAGYLLAAAARTIRDVGRLLEGAEAAGKPLATLALDTEVRFTTQRDRDAFARELADALAALVEKYHSSTGRPYRVLAGMHPGVPSMDPESSEESA